MENFPFTLIDLTHRLDEQSPSWKGGCGYHLHTSLDYKDCISEVKFRVQKLEMEAGMGTHIDAPSHCDPDGITVDEIPLETLLVPCVVIDVSSKVHENYLISLEDVHAFEKQHGSIPPHSAVLFHTGWVDFWATPRYHNNFKFPSLSGDAAHYLLTKNISGIGMDTLSPDRPESGYPVHAAILGAGKWIIENLTHLNQLPPKGAFFLAMPIKIASSEAPMRCIAFLKK
jgi:kynurenine formamidase